MPVSSCLPILGGRFFLETESRAVTEGWESLIEGASFTSGEEACPPFSVEFQLRRDEASGAPWRLSLENEWETDLPFFDPGAVLAQVEQYACGEVMKRSRPDFLPAHAAVVSPSEGGVILILGKGFAGKTTLGVSLWEDGWDLLSDDRCLLEPEPGVQLRVVPIPRRVSVRPSSLSLFGMSTREGIAASPFAEAGAEPAGEGVARYLFHPARIRKRAFRHEGELRGVVVLSEACSGATREEKVGAMTVMRDLLQCTSRREEGTVHELIAWWANHLAELPVYRLGRCGISRMRDSMARIAAEVGLRSHA